ncbi:MAG: RNA-binding protein [Candidatus Iainarchaeum archaeon]|uniref:Exosome complex component Rrp42 n=1 Tax=Candidatus Iainarchaeum sp. TaxID=3101447 RepID=A0A497JHX8_9ARCH|nr:MAG: RNA-binding protein [Candidatus Diapherotrites archaeon]
MEDIYWILQADKVYRFLQNNKRLDGRKFDEYRKAVIVRDFSKNADGSAYVKLGKTEVIAGVKLDLGQPYPDTPDEGGLSTGAELLPTASPEWEAGPPDPQSIELARVVDRCIRESKGIDMKSLCIREGELCYVIYLDFYVTNYDGNLFDACSLAGTAALMNTKVPKVENDKIVKGEYIGKLKFTKKPLLTTFVKLKNYILLDPSLEEDKILDARLHVATTEDGKICAFQKGGSGSFTPKEIESCVELALKKSKELRSLL